VRRRCFSRRNQAPSPATRIAPPNQDQVPLQNRVSAILVLCSEISSPQTNSPRRPKGFIRHDHTRPSVARPALHQRLISALLAIIRSPALIIAVSVRRILPPSRFPGSEDPAPLVSLLERHTPIPAVQAPLLADFEFLDHFSKVYGSKNLSYYLCAWEMWLHFEVHALEEFNKKKLETNHALSSIFQCRMMQDIRITFIVKTMYLSIALWNANESLQIFLLNRMCWVP
jgi:hypothetical protein